MYSHLHIILFSSIFCSAPLLTKSAKILGIFPVLSKSHHSINQPIVKGLAAIGHEVTIISNFKSKHAVPNYTEILFNEGLEDFIDAIAIQDVDNYSGIWTIMKFIYQLEKSYCDNVFGSQYVQQLIRKADEKPIDLIIAEVYHTQCFHLLAHKLNVPLIVLIPVSLNPGLDYFIGNPNNPSVVPLDKFPPKMNFFQRIENTYTNVVVYLFHHYLYDDNKEKYAREVFHIDLPSVEELNRRTAFAFYNNHFSFIPRPMSPNAIDIAGIHITEPKQLPKDIAEFIEGAAHGAILFSFGSTIKASSMSSEKLKVIVDAFSAIPQRILWRVNELNITEVPLNVKLGKWFPQRDILDHKNVIGFISHCGLQGTLEAIHTATPVVAMPFAFDQLHDANLLVDKEAGVYVDYFTMDKNILIDAINEVVTNPKYRENMQRLSRVFRDRPMSPLDESLYWTEYVLKHKGAPHLRPVAADMPLYQYLLLDVLVFILGVLLSIAYFCKFTFKFIVFRICRRKLKKDKIQ